MKLLALAWKDLRRQFRSGLLLLMMIGVPLLLTGLLYFAFGSTGAGPGLSPISVAVVDLDTPPPLAPVAVGKIVASALASPELARLIEPASASDAATARRRVRAGDLGAAVIVPAHATATLLTGTGTLTLDLVTDPGRPLAAGVLRGLLQSVADGLSSGGVAARVTAELADAQGVPGAALLAARAATSAGAQAGTDRPAGLVVAPPREGGPSFVKRMVAEVMAAMMIFFVFFSGAYGASAVLREQEEGTLRRLAVTPTTTATQLGGRFLGIAAILVVQIASLLVVSGLVFGIGWGRPLPVALASAALAVDAAGFGVVLLAFVRTSRQSGPVFGVVLTVTGMVGGLMTATMPSLPTAFHTVALFTPQGWAMDLWRACLAGGDVRATLPALVGTVAIGAGLLAVGVPLMRRRLAQGR
jgi:ABC-2 type transport system permease protein